MINTAKTFSGLAGELGELVPQLRDLTIVEARCASWRALRAIALRRCRFDPGLVQLWDQI